MAIPKWKWKAGTIGTPPPGQPSGGTTYEEKEPTTTTKTSTSTGTPTNLLKVDTKQKMGMPPPSPSIYEEGQPLEGKQESMISSVVEKKIEENIQDATKKETPSTSFPTKDNSQQTTREEYQQKSMTIKKGDTTYTFSPELTYLYEKSTSETKRNIVANLGMAGFFPITQEAYRELTIEEKEEYGFLFTKWETISPSEIKSYPGGQQYLSSLSEKERENLIDKYLESNKSLQQESQAVQQRDITRALFPKTYEDITLGKGSSYKPVSERERRETAWDVITTQEQELKEKYYSELGVYPKAVLGYSKAFTDVLASPVTIPQALIKWGTGKQVGPDVARIMHETHPASSGSPGLIGGTISEVIGFTKGKSPGSFEKIKKDPLTAISSTIGEITGGITIGKAFHTVKAGTLEGLGKARSFIQTRTGLCLPSYTQISYYYPSRVVRRWFVQRGTKNIDDVIRKPYHSTKTLTEGGLSYAPGRTIGGRITWTKQKLFESKKLGFDDEYLVASSSGERIGRKFIIEKKSIHELPSLSTTPYGYAPTRFYRFGSQNLSYSSGTTLFPRMHIPSGFAIPLKKIMNPLKGSYEDIAKWASRQKKGSWGMISPKMAKGGPETEINIFGRTVMKRYLPDKPTLSQRLRGYEYYTDVPLGEKGFISGKPLIEKVPVVFTEPVHKGYPTGVTSIEKTIKKIKEFGTKTISDQPSTSAIHIYSLSPSIPIISKPSSNISRLYSFKSSPSFYSSYSSPKSYSSGSSPSSSSSSSKPSSTSKPISSIVSTPSSSIPSSPSSSVSIPSIPSSSSSISISSISSYSYPSYPYLPSKTKKKKGFTPKTSIPIPKEGARKKKHPTTLLFKEFNI